MKPIVRWFILLLGLALGTTGCLGDQHSLHRTVHDDARNGDAALVARDLAQDPANLNLPDDAGLTPLHLAASFCHTNVVQLLLDKGAEVDARSKAGSTPLHIAAQEGCAAAVDLLLAHHADINARDNHGYTPLKCAELWQQPAVADLLRTRGAKE